MTDYDPVPAIAAELALPAQGVAAVVALLAEGAASPVQAVRSATAATVAVRAARGRARMGRGLTGKP